MGKAIIELEVGVNKTARTIGIRFPKKTYMLELDAISALELAKQLIQRAKDIEEAIKLEQTMDEIGRIIQ